MERQLNNGIVGDASFELRDDLELSKHVLLGRNAIWLSTGLVIPWTLLLASLGEWVCAALVLSFLLPGFVALYLYSLGATLAARVLWLLSASVIATSIAFLYSGQTSHEVTFFILLGFPFLILSSRRERKQLLLSLGFILIMALLSFMDASYALGANVGLPQKTPIEASHHVQFGIFLTVTLLLITQLGYLTSHLNRSYSDIREALTAARDATQARSRFLANMSHEIRTPMNGIIGTLDILEHSGIQPNQRQSMATIRESAMSLLRVIDDVLDASKIDANKLDIVATKTELASLIEQVALTLVPLASSHGVRLRLFIDPQLPDWIEIDAGRLRQILLNVFSNAVKYSASSLTNRRGDVILFALKGADGDLILELQDNGIGMDEKLVATFCDPYVQGCETLFESIRGTGLGMSISKRLIELMGGELKVSSALSKGTTIVIRLPLAAIDSPSLRPDLTGLRVIGIGRSPKLLSRGWDVVLGNAGVTFDLLEDVPECAAFGKTAGERPIYLLFPAVPEELDRIESSIRAQDPGAGIIRCTTDRSVLLHKTGSGTIVFPVQPMIRNDFFASIAELAGRRGMPPEDGTDTAKQNGAKPAPSEELGNHILLVDDNAINLHVLQSQLALLGHHPVTASNGREALLQWKAGDFDMIITDCQMPEMSGFALARAIRLHEKEHGMAPVPILAVTANIDKQNEQKFAAAGMNAWVLKPVTFDTLRESIEQAVGGKWTTPSGEAQPAAKVQPGEAV